jgi:hypothetical protein
MDTNTLIAVVAVTVLLTTAVVWLAYKFRGRSASIRAPLGAKVELQGGGGVVIEHARAGGNISGTDSSGGGVAIKDAQAEGDITGTTTGS